MRNQIPTRPLVRLLMLISLFSTGAPRAVAENGAPAPVPVAWQTKARFHRNFKFTDERGTLVIGEKGVAFEGESGRKLSWTFLDIQNVQLAPHRMIVQSYVSRAIGGDKEYRFDLIDAVPPSIAASLATALQRPSQNAVPDLQSPAVATIHARHRQLRGGTNGILRFRSDGIDYVANASGDSRSWRWADLQTLSAPDSYHLLVFGYRDNYTFDLKEPVSRTLIDEASMHIFEASRNSTVAAPIQK